MIDFGIARYVGQSCGGDGLVTCSRGWAAPEQLRAEPATAAVDVFAWGCVLAYLAGGVHPFAGRSKREWVLRVQSAEADLLGIPPVLSEVFRRSVARDPSQRPSAPELAAMCGTYDVASRQTVDPALDDDSAADGRPRAAVVGCAAGCARLSTRLRVSRWQWAGRVCGARVNLTRGGRADLQH